MKIRWSQRDYAKSPSYHGAKSAINLSTPSKKKSRVSFSSNKFPLHEKNSNRSPFAFCKHVPTSKERSWRRNNWVRKNQQKGVYWQKIKNIEGSSSETP